MRKRELRVHLIRHGQTPGNAKKCYIGRTDESLSAEGVQMLRGKTPPEAAIWVASPMKRCLQTWQVLTGQKIDQDIQPDGVQGVRIVLDFRECDFGLFENRNYLQLSDSAYYARWIESGGTLPFPKGEDPAAFKIRCRQAFHALAEELLLREIPSANLVVHGGTIMSILDAFLAEQDKGGRSYYDWSVPNGCGCSVRVTDGPEGMCMRLLRNACGEWMRTYETAECFDRVEKP